MKTTVPLGQKSQTTEKFPYPLLQVEAQKEITYADPRDVEKIQHFS